VVLHGGPDFNHAYLLPDLDALASDFRLIYYDQRGRGKSSAGVAPQDVGIASEVDDLERLRAHLGFGRFALLGHSWGCVLAMEYAARHARRVSHLILLNAAPASHEDLLRFRAQRQAVQAHDLAKMQAIAATTAYARGDIDAEAEYYRLHFARALQRAGDVDIVVRRVRSHFTPDDIVKARAIEERLYDETWRRPDYDVVARLRASRVRTLLVHGERDLVPVECARRIADGLPDATCVVLDRCGHFSYLERPGEVKAAVTRFVGVTAPAGTPPGPPSPVP
jgi:proline iminopeptidase